MIIIGSLIILLPDCGSSKENNQFLKIYQLQTSEK